MQVDLDLGNYERFMDLTLHKDNNITTGKVYQVSIHGLSWLMQLPCSVSECQQHLPFSRNQIFDKQVNRIG